MKAEENKLIRFLEGHDKSFIIPVYQRNYDWKKENCARLLEDLKDVSIHDRKSHFFGSLVVIYNDDGEGQEHIIIDGQQRVTTVSLLLLALIRSALDKGVPKSEIDTEMIMNEYLVGKYTQENKIKLKPVKNDKQAFSRLFDDPDLSVPSNITRNYKFFLDSLSDKDAGELVGIYNAIKKLDVVEIRLKRGEDDPQLIFESLNSTGLDLTEADKVRNFVLMNLKVSEQEKYYEKYWNKIEENTKYDVSSFLKDYLTMKESKIPNKDRVYSAFRNYFLSTYKKYETGVLLEELLSFSKHYRTIIAASHHDMRVSDSLSNLIRLDMSVTYPFLLEVFDDAAKGTLNDEDLARILSILEGYILRRFMCDVPTNALNKIFMTLARDIKKVPEYECRYVDILSHILLSKKSSQRLPRNDEFREKLREKDIYNLKAKNKVFFLERLENYKNRERVDVEKMLEEGSLSIEHVMPQTLSPAWKKYLGDEAEQIHERFLHTLGNITLTAYNSELSNKMYREKLTQEDGLLVSRLYLNGFFKNYPDWNEKAIQARAELLIDRAAEIWPVPTTTYREETPSRNVYDLSEDVNFTGEKIASFSFWNVEYKAISWIDFYHQLVSLLYDLEPAQVDALVDDVTFNRNRIIARSEGDVRKSIKISEALYIEKNLSAESIITYARQFLAALHIEESEVTITLQEGAQ